MSITDLIKPIITIKRSDADLINKAKANLNDIGSVFRDTINNYRSHAEVTRSQAQDFEMRAAELQDQANKVRLNSKELDLVAREADVMADHIEKALGGAKFLELNL